jgi:hypothetical protein
MLSSRIQNIVLAGTLLASAGLAAGCPSPRTSAATQTTPKDFDASKSDAKAVAIADEVITAVGGVAAFDKAHQISFTEKVILDGQEKVNVHHDWDRWNGRHRFEKKDPATQVDVMVAYEIYGEASFAEIDGKNDVPRETIAQVKGEALKRVQLDTFNLLFPFKLKDPGVTLKYVEERAEPAAPDKPVYDVIRVSFDAGVGPSPGDVYYVVVDKATHLIKHIELVEQGKADNQRIGYAFSDWQDVGGLKLSLKRQNIGYAAELLEFSGVKISATINDDLFVKPITGP